MEKHESTKMTQKTIQSGKRWRQGGVGWGEDGCATWQRGPGGKCAGEGGRGHQTLGSSWAAWVEVSSGAQPQLQAAERPQGEQRLCGHSWRLPKAPSVTDRQRERSIAQAGTGLGTVRGSLHGMLHSCTKPEVALPYPQTASKASSGELLDKRQ